MENYSINISIDKEIYHFEIGEYLHHDGESCKVKVFQAGKLVASFEPDPHDFLQICQNPGHRSRCFMIPLLAIAIFPLLSFCFLKN